MQIKLSSMKEFFMNEYNIIDFPTKQSVKELSSDEGVVIVCGKSSITLFPDGRIEFRGTSIVQISETAEIQATRVDICP
jgi:hypothetical protein